MEKGNLDVGQLLPNIKRGQPEIVIMDPDQGIISGIFAGGIGKEAINLLEVFPVRAFIGKVLGK